MKKFVTVWGLCLALCFVLGCSSEEMPTIESVKPVEEEPFIVDPIPVGIAAVTIEPTLEQAILKASDAYDCPVPVILAVISTESGLASYDELSPDTITCINVSARSSYNCVGPMQLSSYAVAEYNKFFHTAYVLKDAEIPAINIDIGVWYFMSRKPYCDSWEELYVIYNVGYGQYMTVNTNYFFGYDGVWYTNHYNRFFYLHDLYPPTESYTAGLTGTNMLPRYNAKKRFVKCLDIYNTLFSTNYS